MHAWLMTDKKSQLDFNCSDDFGSKAIPGNARHDMYRYIHVHGRNYVVTTSLLHLQCEVSRLSRSVLAWHLDR